MVQRSTARERRDRRRHDRRRHQRPAAAEVLDRLLEDFPDLSGLEPEARVRLGSGCRAVTVPPGTVLFAEGDVCQSYVLVLSGSVKVRKVSESGREIVLYRVERGQTCVLTTACLMGATDYSAEGVAETEVEAVVVPSALFRALIDTSPVFRAFVFSVYATRVSDLLMLIEEVAFGRIDVRLSHTLLDRADGDGRMVGTHQDLATELGTAREVVSRQLKDFERRGWVTLGRGRVELTDRAAPDPPWPGIRDDEVGFSPAYVIQLQTSRAEAWFSRSIEHFCAFQEE